MAIREINSLYNANYNIDKMTQLHAGAIVARGATGLVVAADRATHGTGAYLGFLADDTARSGNTRIDVDPVGSTYIDPLTGNFVANNNGYYNAPRRALSDYQAEDVTNVTNFTAGASGFQGPARGVGVYTSGAGSNIFVTDQFALYKTDDTSPSNFADAAFGGGDTYNISDLVTYGTGANAGLLVKVVSADNNGKVIGRVDLYDASSGTLTITQL